MFDLAQLRPQRGDKYFITKKNGGFSPCIQIAGAPVDLDTLGNCVGYAVGMFNKIAGAGYCKYLGSTNAENMAELAMRQGLRITTDPKLGGCMVWRKGKAGNGADGAGHVAIVSGLNPDGSVVTSDSAYNGTVYYTKERSGARWSQPAGYTYIGCIVNPSPMYPAAIPNYTLRRGCSGDGVKWLQACLQANGHSCGAAGIDGHFGADTERAVVKFQIRWGLTPDGVAGRITKRQLAANFGAVL